MDGFLSYQSFSFYYFISSILKIIMPSSNCGLVQQRGDLLYQQVQTELQRVQSCYCIGMLLKLAIDLVNEMLVVVNKTSQEAHASTTSLQSLLWYLSCPKYQSNVQCRLNSVGQVIHHARRQLHYMNVCMGSQLHMPAYRNMCNSQDGLHNFCCRVSLNSYLINYLFLEQYIYILLGGYWGMNKRVSRPFHNPL